MAFTPVPTFSDGAILTASDLGILADNLEYLNSLVSGVNVPFSSDSVGSVTNPASSRPWTFRHVARYYHYRLRVTDGETESVQILFNEVAEFNDGTDRTAPYQYDGYLDSNSFGSPPSLLDFITFRVVVDWNVTPGNMVVDYILASDSTAI